MKKNNPVNISVVQIPQAYNLWRSRLYRLLFFFQRGLISEKELEMYQLLLLETAQFNANFTLTELQRLDYPRAPFAIMDRGTYLRTTDTWSMQVLRALYREESRNDLHPIWIDSNLFWSELKRYCRVISANVDDLKLQAILLGLWQREHIGRKSEEFIFIKVDKQEFISNCDGIKQRIKQAIWSCFLRERRIEESLYNILIAFFSNMSTIEISNDISKGLEILFPEVVETVQNGNKQLIEDLQRDQSQYDDRWFKKVLGLGRKYQILPEETKNWKRLQAYSRNQAEFEKFLNELKAKVVTDVETLKKAMKQHVNKWSEDITKYIMEHIIFYAKDSFKIQQEEVQAILTTNPKKIEGIIGCMGYRIDPVKMTRVVLRAFPRLFVDLQDTQKFWKYFSATQQMKSLSSQNRDEVQIIEQVIREFISGFNIQSVQFERLCPWAVFQNSTLKLLQDKSTQYSKEFRLYSDYLFKFLERYFLKMPSNSSIRMFFDQEVHEALDQFISACDANNISKAVRCAQNITEVLLVFFEFQPIGRSIVEIYQTDYLKDYQIQGVMITPYAMRAFVRVFQLLDELVIGSPMKVYATDQGYYEWLLNLESLNKELTQVCLVQHLNEIHQDADVCFVDIHPNNFLASKQFAHNIPQLFERFAQLEKPRTLVIDVTLNALNDEEIMDFLQKASTLVSSGKLNIILIQSLTKFLQLGLDKRSGGVVIVINNNSDYWSSVNEKLKKLQSAEVIDCSTKSFFSFFSDDMKEQVKLYVQYINAAVRKTYYKTMQHLLKLEVLTHNRFQLTISSDPKACFVALNVNGLLTMGQGEKSIQKMCEYILNHLIFPLCDFYHLPITERMSIGFPLSSINVVLGSLRFTVGLETKTQLNQYAEIFAYVSFVLNREHEYIFDNFNFEKPETNDFLNSYFSEKVQQFKAMTTGANEVCEIIFEDQDPYNSYTNPRTNERRQLQKKINMSNGRAKLSKEQCDIHHNMTFVEYEIHIPVRGLSNLMFNDARISELERKMMMACFTDNQHLAGKKRYQNVTLTFDNWKGYHVELSNMQIFGLWNVTTLYGPFPLGKQSLYFSLYQRMITVYVGDQSFAEENILVKQGNIVTPLTDMSIAEREYLIREGGYEPIRCGYNENLPRKLPKDIDMLYKPIKSNMRLSLTSDGKLLVENDFICVYKPGVTIYKRYIDNMSSCFEINYWQVKNPVVARLMQLLTVVYLKEKYQIEFNTHDEAFSHFILNIHFDHADQLFDEAVLLILGKEKLLEKFIENFKKDKKSQYLFQKNKRFHWPSGYVGIDYINDDNFLIDALNVLNEPKKLTLKSKPFEQLKEISETTMFTNSQFIDQQLSLNGLCRGSATTQGNNCLLDSYFQLITGFFALNFPNCKLGNLEGFSSYVREKIGVPDGQMLMINDEEQGVQILSAIKQFITDKTGFNVGFDLAFMVAMDDEVTLIDNIAEFQNQFSDGEFIIPIKIIQVGYNHYKPVFGKLVPMPNLECLSSNESALRQTAPAVSDIEELQLKAVSSESMKNPALPSDSYQCGIFKLTSIASQKELAMESSFSIAIGAWLQRGCSKKSISINRIEDKTIILELLNSDLPLSLKKESLSELANCISKIIGGKSMIPQFLVEDENEIILSLEFADEISIDAVIKLLAEEGFVVVDQRNKISRVETLT